MISTDAILMIEPTKSPSATPVVDDLTRRMAGALLQAVQRHTWRGWHDCTGRGCHGKSDNADHFVMDISGREWETNSLAVHYIAYHREECSEEQLHRVRCLAALPSEPTPEQLRGYADDAHAAAQRQHASRLRGETLIRELCARTGARCVHLGSTATLEADRDILERIADDLGAAGFPAIMLDRRLWVDLAAGDIEPPAGWLERVEQHARREGVLLPTA